MYVVYDKTAIICDGTERISNRKYYNNLDSLLEDFPDAVKDSHQVDCARSGLYYDILKEEDSQVVSGTNHLKLKKVKDCTLEELKEWFYKKYDCLYNHMDTYWYYVAFYTVSDDIFNNENGYGVGNVRHKQTCTLNKEDFIEVYEKIPDIL